MKNGTDISQGTRSLLPPSSLRDTGTMRINLGVTFVASVAVRMNITLCIRRHETNEMHIQSKPYI
jgi:hypothetical protein